MALIVSSLRRVFLNMTFKGLIVIMFTMLLVFGGVAFIFLTALSVNQTQFQVAFNQSVVENRERARQDQAFRDVELQDIERSQNNTREFIPLLLESFEDIKTAVSIMNQLQEPITFLRSNFNESMLESTAQEYSTTTQMNQSINEIKDLLKSVNSSLAQQITT